MATYKVIQDIEAEDKLLGPLSFRQFIYFMIAAFFGYLNFVGIAKGAPWLLIIFLPPMLFCLFFAWPWSPDQPTEVWALARIRFLFKPRKRIWDQSGIKEFVTVTAPKRIEKVYTDGLSQQEVRSRLHALANTIDSRGWAVKNAYNPMTNRVLPGQQTDSDRLLDIDHGAMDVPSDDYNDSDDILDDVNNPTAYHMNQMIDASTKAHRERILDQLRAQGATIPAGPPSTTNWFMQPAQQLPQPVIPEPYIATPDDVLPIIDPKAQPTANMRTIQPTDAVMPTPVAPAAPASPAAPAAMPVNSQPTPAPAAARKSPDPAIINLAHNNDLNVATLAREANKALGPDVNQDGEVVISLH